MRLSGSANDRHYMVSDGGDDNRIAITMPITICSIIFIVIHSIIFIVIRSLRGTAP